LLDAENPADGFLESGNDVNLEARQYVHQFLNGVIIANFLQAEDVGLNVKKGVVRLRHMNNTLHLRGCGILTRKPIQVPRDDFELLREALCPREQKKKN
jgi:hypothetical protein